MPESIIGLSVRGGGRAQPRGTIIEENWPWIRVEWDDRDVTWSDGRPFSELADLRSVDHGHIAYMESKR